MKDIINIEKERLNRELISEDEFNNFVLCTNNFNINIEELNEVEEKLYKEICKSEVERKWIIYKNFQKISENIVNEMIYKDIQMLTERTPWVTTNMDSLYNIKMDHIRIHPNISYKILPKSKEKMRIKIINSNIIITTLFRYEGIVLHNKMKEDIEFELKEKISFTKGYTVCIKPESVNKMKMYSYYRKCVMTKKTEIKAKSEIMSVKEYLSNKNYSDNIWIKEDNVNELNTNKIKILNNILDDKINTKDFVDNINFLNSIELSINKKTINEIYKFIDNNVEINELYITKNKIVENIYKINDKEDNNFKNIDNMDFQKIINSASMLEIIIKQINKYEKFYINNAYDSRMRIYAQTWPVNYQLSHIIRSSILINNDNKIEDIIKNFYNNKEIKENYIECKDSLNDKISIDTNIKLDSFINKNMKWNGEEIKIKKECLIMVLRKLSPNSIKDLNEKLNFAIDNYEEFMDNDILDNWDKWKEKLKIKENKVTYLIGLKENIKKISKNNFSETFWLDASSNAIQLIALRMGCKNEKLLMLTNIIDNKTEYENIYDYVTKKIKEMSHSDIIIKIKNKLNKEDLDSLRDKDDSKYLIMPACYGMGKYKNRINIENKLKDNKKWMKLDEKEKNIVSDYFWNKTFEILRELEFELEEYKKICNKMKDYDVFIWKNDVDLPIAPINTRKSKRQELIKKLNELKMKKNDILDKEVIKKIESKIKVIKEKMKNDDRLFWKRTMVRIKGNKIIKNIYIRIPNSEKIIDKRMTLQALAPNSIHSYDASVMFLCIKICREIGIEILVIHDCIGCRVIDAPIVKKIFKIANLIILKKSINIIPFPIKENNINHMEYEKLKIKILESENFFR